MVKVYLLSTIPPKYLDFLGDYFHSEKRKNHTLGKFFRLNDILFVFSTTNPDEHQVFFFSLYKNIDKNYLKRCRQ